MVRFVHFFNYAEGMSAKGGEDWYLNNHVPRVKKLPGIKRYLSWKRVDVKVDSVKSGATPFDQFVRRSELWFEDLEVALKFVTSNLELWTPSKKGTPGFREFECMFLNEEPEFNLLQDAPQQQYKYMTLPLWWPKGRPLVDETAEIFIDTYCLTYLPDKTSIANGEDWYLGHHTREGKQLPGMKHYKTWKTIRVPEYPNSPLHPNKWYRLTELGMSPDAFNADMVDDETRILFTPSPIPNVLAGWMNISIKLDKFTDLIK